MEILGVDFTSFGLEAVGAALGVFSGSDFGLTVEVGGVGVVNGVGVYGVVGFADPVAFGVVVIELETWDGTVAEIGTGVTVVMGVEVVVGATGKGWGVVAARVLGSV